MSRNYAAEIGARGKEITAALNTSNTQAALKAALRDPPYGCTDEKLKADNIATVSGVLRSFKKEADVDKVIDGLTVEEIDVLMKYIYASLAREDSDKILLYWHATTLKKAGGLGCVIRVLADKLNTVV
eukprot:TRINITY_DN13687_c0_g1_i1.p1 TRINITY_DN13687_c0_g1~~TRINITY_DN13687_c0_g1_i1.p1  ORF type:complete len:128 (+),score=34.61 TRINITY_DN13687_c0_g1_i1:73-456(+)